jgi:putative endonuclease
MKQPTVYILASRKNGTLYTGVTSDLIRRITEHREATSGFTARYNVKTLVWYSSCPSMEAAILEEKRLKGGSRAAKARLIMQTNPDWLDLYPGLLG